LKFDHINGPGVPVGLEQAIEASLQALEGVVGRSQELMPYPRQNDGGLFKIEMGSFGNLPFSAAA
jgi:hypothetical protein